MKPVKLEHNHPLPRPYGELAKTIRQMKVGDSFLMDKPPGKTACYGDARNAGVKIAVRRVADGWRVWRPE